MENSKEHIEAQLAAYIDGELDDAERAEIERHLAASPRHRTLIQELLVCRNLVQDLPRASSPAELNDLLTNQLERSALLDGDPEQDDRSMRINRWPQFAAVAAVILLAVGLAVVVMCVLPPAGNNSSPIAINHNGDIVVKGDGESARLGDGRKAQAAEKLVAAPTRKQSETEREELSKKLIDLEKGQKETALSKMVEMNSTRSDPSAAKSLARTDRGLLPSQDEKAKDLAPAPLVHDAPQITIAEIKKAQDELGMGDGKTADYYLVVNSSDVGQANRQVTAFLAQKNINYMAVKDETDRLLARAGTRSGEGLGVGMPENRPTEPQIAPGAGGGAGGGIAMLPKPSGGAANESGDEKRSGEGRLNQTKDDHTAVRRGAGERPQERWAEEVAKARHLNDGAREAEKGDLKQELAAGQKGAAYPAPTAPSAPAKPAAEGEVVNGPGGAGPLAARSMGTDVAGGVTAPTGKYKADMSGRIADAADKDNAERRLKAEETQGNMLVATMNRRQAMELKAILDKEPGQAAMMQARVGKESLYFGAKSGDARDAGADALNKLTEEAKKLNAENGLPGTNQASRRPETTGAARDPEALPSVPATQPAIVTDALREAQRRDEAGEAISVLIIIRSPSAAAAAPGQINMSRIAPVESSTVPADAKDSKNEALKK